MGFLSKLGKNLKKAVKDVGKVAKKAYDVNPVFPGSKAQKQLAGVAKQALPVVTGFLGAGPILGGASAAAPSLLDVFNTAAADVIQAGKDQALCALTGTCGSKAAPAPSSTFVSVAGSPPASSGTPQESNQMQKILVIGGALALAWYLFLRKKG